MTAQANCIDVVICTYNNAALLERTLESLAAQQVPASLQWGILVVDNASTDRTANVVEAFRNSGGVTQLEYVYEETQGLVPARIRGARETSAPWIAFVDDDCLLDQRWLANAVTFIGSHRTCGGFGGIVRLTWETPPDNYVRRYGYSYAEQELGSVESRREWLVGAGLVVSRVALEQSGWLETQYLDDRKGRILLSGGDMEMTLRIRAAGFELWYTPSCLIHHYIAASRIRLDYLTRINWGLGVSQTWCDLLVSSRPFWMYVAKTLIACGRSYLKALKQALRIATGRREAKDFRIELSFANGRVAGLRQTLWLSEDRRRATHGCASSHPEVRHIALMHWGDLLEDFLGEIGLTLENFREEMSGGWMFGYVKALQTANIETTLMCVSARVRRVESWTHGPTGASICVLPVGRLYRLLRWAGIDSAVWKNRKRRADHVVAWHIKRLLQDVLPYLATPMVLLRREVKARQCQAIVCQEYEHARFDLSVLAGTLSGIPVFATFQGGNTRFSRLERLFRGIAVRKSNSLIIGSSRERERVRKRYAISDRRMAPIFNPLDVTVWYPEDRRSARSALGLPQDAFLVAWHGRIDLHRKGLDLLIDSWRRLLLAKPGLDGYLVMVGTGPDTAELMSLIEAENVERVIWRDEYVLDRAAMRCYLSAADVYAFTSRHEGFPVAPLEAMACGLPVVAMDCAGLRDILSDASDGGIITPLEDPRGLAESLARLLDDEVLRRKTGRDARRRVVESFGLDTVGDRLKKFLSASREIGTNDRMSAAIDWDRA